jgi:hypothetical protein
MSGVIDAYLKGLQEDCAPHFRVDVERLQEQVARINPRPVISKRVEEERAWLILDWLARGVHFVWLERADFIEQRERLRMFRAITRDTANDAFAILTIFDTELIMPVLQAGKIAEMEAESQRLVELEQQCGIYAATSFSVNAAVQGSAMAKLYSVILTTAGRIISACMQKSIRDTGIESAARTLYTIGRVERSIGPLIQRLLAVR